MWSQLSLIETEAHRVCNCIYFWLPVKNISEMHKNNRAQIAIFMGPKWVLSAPGGPHVGPMNLAIREIMLLISDDIDSFPWNVVTHTYPNFNAGLVILLLELGLKCLNISHLLLVFTPQVTGNEGRVQNDCSSVELRQ